MPEPASRVRPRLLLLENSLHTTGAFGSAMKIADDLAPIYDIEFLLPSTSTLKPIVEAAGMVCHVLPMSEIGRSWWRLLKYVPLLMVNTIRLRQLIYTRKFNVMVVNDYYNLLGFTVRASGWRGIVLTFVRLLPFSQQRHVNKLWVTLALWGSDKVLAVSRAVEAQLPASKKVEVFYNPVRFEERLPAAAGRRDDDEVRCLYLSNYIVGKGQLHGLQAFAQAYRDNPALRLRFVGGDMDLEKNRKLKSALQAMACHLGVDSVVTFDGYSNEVERDIKEADIVLNFSESESFSQTCLEASAFGRPIIATRCGGPEEIVQDGVSGLLVDTKDVNAMATAVLRLSRDREMREAMGIAGRSLVREQFSAHRTFAELERIFGKDTHGLP